MEEACQMDMLTRQLHVRWMVRSDFQKVLRIEEQTFSDPWNEETFIAVLKGREAIGMVAERQGEIVGFMVYFLHPSRIHLVNFGVEESVRLRGVGKAMIDRLKSKLGLNRRTKITADIIETNLEMQLFLRSIGFRCTGIARELFPNGKRSLDGLRFEYPIDERTG